MVGGVVLIGFLLWQVEPQTIVRSLRDASPRWLFVGCLYYLLTNVLRAWRLGVLLRIPGISSPLRLLPELFALSFLNNVLPSRTGELSFPYFLYRRHKRSIGESTTALLLARIFDYIAVASLFLLFAFGQFSTLALDSTGLLQIVAILLLISLIMILSLAWFSQFLLWQIERLADQKYIEQGTVQGRILTLVSQLATQATSTLQIMREGRIFVLTLGWSFAIWLTTFAWFDAFLRATDFNQPYPLVVVGATLASIAKAIPFISIGGFGAHEAGWTIGFSLVGMNIDEAITSGFAVNILTLGMSILFGGPMLIYLGLQGQRSNRQNKTGAESVTFSSSSGS